MSLMEAVKTCFKKYAVFSGRARRSEYWKFSLFNMLVSVVILVIGAVLSDTPEKTGTGFVAIYGLSGLYMLVALLPGIAVLVRRLHDVGKSGGYIFFALIPAVGAIMLLIWMVQDSDPGDNQYGPNPKIAGTKTPPVPPIPPEKYWAFPACGEKVKESASFCTHCGTSRSGSGSGVTVKTFTPAPPKEPSKPDPSIWEIPTDF